MNTIFNSLKHRFFGDRFGFVIEAIVYLMLFAFLVLFPIFTYNYGKTIIVNIASALLCLAILIYLFFRGKIIISFFSVGLISFAVYALLLTCFTTRDFDKIISFFTIFSLSIFVYFFLYNSKSQFVFEIIFIISSCIFAIIFFISNRSSIMSFDFDRLGSEYGNVNTSGLFFSASVMFGTKIAFQRKKWFLLFLPISIIMTFFSTLSGSKLALFISLLSWLINLYFLFKKRKILYFITIIVLIGAMILILQLPVFSSINRRILSMFDLFFGSNTSRYNYDGSTATRINMFIDAISLWLKNIFLGNGSDAFENYGSYGVYSHSAISEVLCNFGLVGFILFFGPMIYLFIKSSKEHFSSNVMPFLSFFILCSLFTIGIVNKLFILLFGYLYSFFTYSQNDHCYLLSFAKENGKYHLNITKGHNYEC